MATPRSHFPPEANEPEDRESDKLPLDFLGGKVHGQMWKEDRTLQSEQWRRSLGVVTGPSLLKSR